MFSLTGLQNFYYMPDVRDMRLGYHRLSEIVRLQYNRDPHNGDVYLFISKDRRRIRIFRYENEAYYLYEKYYDRGLTFMKLECDLDTDERRYKLEYKELVALLDCPVRSVLRLRGKYI